MVYENQSVIICGAGISGLSTALHLAKKGAHVTVFDGQAYDFTAYHPEAGCDAASADHNKIFRASYGDRPEYQRMAYDARNAWEDWNEEISKASPRDLPEGITPTDVLYHECGFARLPRFPTDSLNKDELDGLGYLSNENLHLRSKNYILSNVVDRERAQAAGWTEIGHLNPFNGRWKGEGVLDTTAGYVEAYKACVWTAHLCRKADVNFVLGSPRGKVSRLLKDASQQVVGVETADGKLHHAPLTIVAAGPWTPALVDECATNLEATAGSIATIKLPPKEQRPDLWEKYSEKQFPVFSWAADNGDGPIGGLFGFPRNEEGVIKFIYRGVKFTNYSPSSPTGKQISTPLTSRTNPVETNIPLVGLNIIKAFVAAYFPDLSEFGIHWTRMCWYTDSTNNHFLIDYIPGTNNTCFVISGGSGHMFKFTPILGEKVIDALEKRDTELTRVWRWRDRKPGEQANGMEQEDLGPRVLKNITLASPKEWKFNNQDFVRASQNILRSNERDMAKL